jgi:hypothetical protein
VTEYTDELRAAYARIEQLEARLVRAVEFLKDMETCSYCNPFVRIKASGERRIYHQDDCEIGKFLRELRGNQ